MDDSAYRRNRRRRSIAFLIVVVALFVTRRASRHAKDEGAAPSDEQAAAAKYIPEKSEGLGASVAILIDNSGSMKDRARGDERPKYVVAREALEAMLATTDSFVARQPDVPVNVGLYQFSSHVTSLVPVRAYDRDSLRTALERMPFPAGGTAIGDAMDAARADLYRAGTIRKYILVVTDGENTEGHSPASVAREINARSEGAVRMYFVAFDIGAERFNFVHDVRGEVLSAANGITLRSSLDSIYRGRILAESMDAGETLGDSAHRGAASVPADSSRHTTLPTRPRKPTP